MKLLIDMNLSPDWVEVLATEGLEAVHWSKVGSSSAADAMGKVEETDGLIYDREAEGYQDIYRARDQQPAPKSVWPLPCSCQPLK